jgi:hypothetical protein
VLEMLSRVGVLRISNVEWSIEGDENAWLNW